MTHDITFCAAIDCPYKFNCARHINNNKFNIINRIYNNNTKN